MTFGSLFAGIGGFDLGFERAGMECKWQVEIDPYCQRVLAKHWPSVRRHDDVRTFPPNDGTDWRVDVICGGFPCQDVSVAGGRAGIEGKRSGLWFEYARIIRAVRPRIVVVENVSGLLDRGMGRVLGELAACGFDADWISVSASEFGADHERERVYIVAHSEQEQRGNVFHSQESDRQFHREYFDHWGKERDWGIGELDRCRVDSFRRAVAAGVFGVVDGIPNRVESRIGALGNAVVPQIAEWIGRRIVESDQ